MASSYRQRFVYQEIPDAVQAQEAARLQDILEALEHHPSAPAHAILYHAMRDDDLATIEQLAAQWRRNFARMVVVGAGGSGLSARALAFLSPYAERVLVLDNLDAVAFPATLAALDAQNTCFLFVSKSGTTVETLTLCALIIEWLQKNGGNAKAQCAGIAVAGDNPLRALAGRHAIPMLEHDPDLGGRFSILSLVGLIPAAYLELDIRALRTGAAESFRENFAAGTNCAAAYGAAFAHLHMQRERHMHVIMPYSEQLLGLALWWRQGMAESLGKDGQGATPCRALGPADQHSQLQLYLDGPADKCFTLLATDCANTGPLIPPLPAPLDYLSGKTLGALQAAEQRATIETLAARKRPLRVFDVEKTDEYTLGALLAHFTLEILLIAALAGVNPFDQPAVEEGKRLTRAYLSA